MVFSLSSEKELEIILGLVNWFKRGFLLLFLSFLGLIFALFLPVLFSVVIFLFILYKNLSFFVRFIVYINGLKRINNI